MVNPWALPTTGNLAYDDYRRSLNAWMGAHPYTGSEQYDNRGIQDLMGGGIDSADNLNPEHDAWNSKQMQGFFGQLTPEQRNEYFQLASEREAKLRRNGQLAAMASFAAVGGLGALGAGGFGGLGAGMGGDLSSVYGAGSGWGGDTLSAMGMGGTGGGAAAGAAGGSPWESFLGSITKNVGTKLGGSLLSQLISAGGNAYMGNKQAGQYNDVINQINQLYSPTSPYAQQMQQSLARKDAAAGRNSQYGSRAVELAAALTKAKSDALTSPGFGNLLGQRGTNQNSIVNGFLAALGSGPGQDLISHAGSGIGNYLSKFFGSSGDSYSPTSPNSGFNNDWMMAYAPGG